MAKGERGTVGGEGEGEGGEMSLTSFRLYLLDNLKEIWSV